MTTFTGFLKEKNKIIIQHEESKSIIETSPPLDNQGDGSCFSPTDLFAASLASCATTLMSLKSKAKNIDLTSVEFSAVKIMRPQPRSISEIKITYDIKSTCSEAEFVTLIEAAKTCPVRLSLSESVKVTESFFWNSKEYLQGS